MLERLIISCLRIRIIYILALALTPGLNGFAQNGSGSAYTTDTNQINKIIASADVQFYDRANIDSSRILCKIALQKSIGINYVHGKIAALKGLADVCLYASDYPGALTYYRECMSSSIRSEHKKDLAISFNDIGRTQSAMGNYDSAADYYYKALTALKILTCFPRKHP